jgi:hypothetical protein
MPDQYDPKLSRPPSRDARRGAADDPLAELARIVQGRPAVSMPAPKPSQPAPPTNGSNGADLEAELLNDLQASFAAVREAARPTPPAPPAPIAPRPQAAAPVPQPPPVVDEPAEEQEPERPAPRNDSRTELRDEFRLEPFDQSRLVPIPTPPVIQPMIQTSFEAPPLPRSTIERRPEPIAERAPEAPPVERPAAKARPAPPPVVPDLAAFQLRGSSTAPAAAPVQPAAPARQPHSRWERPEAPKPQPAAPSRFAPPRTAAPVMSEEEELDPFAEGGLFADHADAPDAPEVDEDLGLEDLGTFPAYAEDEQLPPLDDDLDALPQRRGISRNVMVIAGVVLVALVGGISFAMFRGGSAETGTPPVIAADGSPTKITPDDTAANDGSTQSKLIYDRVNSGEQSSTDTTLLTPDNGPVQDVDAGTSNNAISRVIIPGGPGIDAPATAGQADTQTADAGTAASGGDPVGQLAANDVAATSDPDAIQPIGPRKVRTVVVKPDGTIVYSNAKDAPPSDAATAGGTTAAAAPATSDGSAATPPTDTAATTAEKPAVTDDVAAITGNTGEALPITAPAADGTAAEATAPADATPPAATADSQPPPAAAKPAATKPTAKPAATEVASADDGASPIDIVPGATASAAAGGVLVQISSQRTEDAARATYRDLQARYPNILGSYQVNIQRADVPDRGTFYRVRVGPFSQTDAQRLCDDLRQAGGDCVLAKR